MTNYLLNEKLSELSYAQIERWHFDFFSVFLIIEGMTESDVFFSLKIEGISNLTYQSEFLENYDLKPVIEEIGKYEEGVKTANKQAFFVCTASFRCYFDAQKITLNDEEIFVAAV